MCGISGIISQFPHYGLTNYLVPMLDSMTHRGPDDRGIEILGNEGCFGHNRLSIIDLNERAKQPMWDNSKRFCVSFNGEIYNFSTLRKELINLGHRFCTQSDTEVLIQAWAEWGISSIHHMVGMFAFAIWDAKYQHLHLVRDRMGEKPLYFAAIDKTYQNGLVFASELKALMKYPFLEKKLSMSALSHYLSFNYTSTADCIFEGVYKLPPASYCHFDLKKGRCDIKEYWSLAHCFQNKLDISFNTAQLQLKNLLAESIKQQMITDVPLGAFLSGGIDSATIVSYMQSNDKQVNTYSIGFKEKSYNELALSQKTAHYLGVNHQTKIVTPDIQNILPQLISLYDEPFADSSLIPTYFLCGYAKQSVKVSLSGDGSDELFGGYVTYLADRYWQMMQIVPLFIRQLFFNMSRHLPTSFNKVSLDYKIKQFLRGSLLDIHRSHLSWREIFTSDQKRKLFHSSYKELLLNAEKIYPLHWFKDVADCHYLDQAMYVDMKTWLVDDILIKIDQSSMAHSLEVRTPFLDHRLVEFAARLPVSYKIRGNKGKRILKESHVGAIPKAVLRKPKKGFNSPISQWLSNELFEMGYDVTTSSPLCHWFDRREIDKLWFHHKKGVCDNGHRLFNLVCLGLWSQRYLQGVTS